MATAGRVLGLKAVVTGGARGIGETIAKALGREGASVAIADMHLQGAEQVASEIKQMGVPTLALRVDVTQSRQVAQMTTEVLREWGVIDILVNNAGGFDRLSSIFGISDAEWDHVIDLNLKSVFLCSRVVAKQMVERRKGRIINIASEAALGPNPFTAPYVPYGAAKAGVVGFTKHLAKELGPYGITVNSVSPGTTATPRVQKLRGAEGLKRIAEMNPMGHLVEPEDIAEAVVFLASEAGRYITGINLNVNSGSLMV